MWRKYLLVVSLAVSTSLLAVAEGPTPEQQYRAAFLANALNAFTVALFDSPEMKSLSVVERESQISRNAQTATECHMAAMQEFSPELREAAYSVVQKGGSYFDAKGAFDLALARERAAGSDREAKVKEMIMGSIQVAKPCLATIGK